MYRTRLPYIDNARAVLTTLAINLVAVLIFNRPGGVSYADVLWDSMICAVITVIIDVWLVHSRLKKMRTRGEMPWPVPESRFMQRLPQNPVALGLVYAIVFAVLAVGANAALLDFFDLRRLNFATWLVYKLAYATVLSVVIVEYCIFRYVQPDWAGRGAGAEDVTRKDCSKPIRNPLPKISLFRAIYGSVTGNLALNVLIGSLLGGAVARPDGSVLIYPTTVEGIPITGLVFGLIFGILATGGVITAMNAVIINSGPALREGAVADRRLAWMPRGRAALTALVCLGVMAFSAVALRAVLVLFDIPVLNFYQFTVFISIYAALLGKALSAILTRRCLQPDYIRHVLK